MDLKKRIRARLRKFLGIDTLEQLGLSNQDAQRLIFDDYQDLRNRLEKQASIGLDIGYHDSVIIIASRVDGGKVRIIDAHLKNAHDLRELYQQLKARFGVRGRAYVDAPLSYGNASEYFDNWREPSGN